MGFEEAGLEHDLEGHDLAATKFGTEADRVSKGSEIKSNLSLFPFWLKQNIIMRQETIVDKPFI